MLFRQLLQLTAATLIAAAAAHANCVPPKEPRDIPDGNEATKQEMMSAHKAVQAYNDQTAEYTSCLQTELDAAIARKGNALKDKERKSMESKMGEKHDAAIDRVQKVAERFNEQLRVFNARRDAAKKSESAAEAK